MEAIRKRCSLKLHLSKRPIEPEKIELVLEAARLAPSARNLQPWRFVVVQGDAAIDELASAFNETNQEVRNGSVIIVVCAREEDDVTREGRPSTSSTPVWPSRTCCSPRPTWGSRRTRSSASTKPRPRGSSRSRTSTGSS